MEFEVDDFGSPLCDGLPDWPSVPFENMSDMMNTQDLFADFSRKDADDFFSTW